MHLQKSKKTIRAVTRIYNKLILSRGYTMFEDKVFCVLRITTSKQADKNDIPERDHSMVHPGS